MKISISIFLPLALVVSMTWTAQVQAEDKAPTGSAQIQSIFILPASSKDGRDPFFPESTRALEAAAATNHTVEISSLKVPGIFGAPGHLLAIINNHTFAVGDEGDVKTPAGMVHLHCLEIQSDHVLVEMNGQVHRIKLEPRSE